MSYAVDFNIVSTVGLESSPVAARFLLRVEERVLISGPRAIGSEALSRQNQKPQ